MKFGEYLRENKTAEWSDKYMDYDTLKSIIKSLEEFLSSTGGEASNLVGSFKQLSLTMSRPTDAKGQPQQSSGINQPTPEIFFRTIEREMNKVDDFTKEKVKVIRSHLVDIENRLPLSLANGTVDALRMQLDNNAEEFLKLEKYVNLNCTGIFKKNCSFFIKSLLPEFLGFHKILKKHDRRLPNPCKAFYLSRLHEQSWVKGDYSDVLVTMSRIYSTIRGDEEAEAKHDEKQVLIAIFLNKIFYVVVKKTLIILIDTGMVPF